MGESIVDRPIMVDKMGESVPSGATLEVSVSLGRFENHSLSWEEWSSFSPNKYLEEVEKCSTPGSVAQKKAYFEAHYKKIAARKAEQLEQEKTLESLDPSSNVADLKDQVKSTPVPDSLFCNNTSTGSVEPDSETTTTVNGTVSEKEEEVDTAAIDSQDLSVEESKKELNCKSANPELNDGEAANEELFNSQAVLESSARGETTQVQQGISEKSCQEIVEPSSKAGSAAKKTPLNKKKSPNLYARNVDAKITPSKKEQTFTSARKKVATPANKQPTATKLLQFSTPRLSKSTVMASSQSSVKKFNGLSLPKGKFSSPGGSRKTVPSSLHMSLTLDRPNSESSFTTTRKSLIMEKMGDKEIVRRAFKTFQNSINGLRSSHDGMFGEAQQVSYKEPRQKVSTTSIPQKENGRLKKSVEKTNQGGQPRNRSCLVTPVSHKGSGVDGKYDTVVLPSTSVRIDAKAVKHKEKLEKKLLHGEVGRPHFINKAKVDKVAPMKNAKQDVNAKATVSQASNQGKSEKGINRTRVSHQPLAKR